MGITVLFVSFLALFATINAQNFGAELNNLDFGKIIGGPINAVIEAQSQAARMTTEFINTVGFVTENGVKTVLLTEFKYQALINDSLKNYTMALPFLTMVPIPYIEIRDITIDFAVKLNSVAKTETSSSTQVDLGLEASKNLFGLSVKMSVNVSHKSESKATSEVKREYGLNIHVNAGQAAMPAGTTRVLDLFESIIRDTIPTH